MVCSWIDLLLGMFSVVPHDNAHEARYRVRFDGIVLSTHSLDSTFDNRCGPCKLIEPVLDQCAQTWKFSLVVGKYDVESQNDELKVELLLLGVMPQALPALILIHKNKVLTTWKGLIRPDELNTMLEEFINNSKYATVQEMTTVASSNRRTAVVDAPRRKSGLISFATVGAGDEYMLRQQ